MKATSTSQRTPALMGEAARPRAVARAIVLPLLLGLAALLPRALGLADFFTTDEAYHWVSRTERFAAAVAAGRWADTNLTGHPGVTLMWLGSLGLRLEQLAVALGWAAAPDQLGHLAWLRLGPVLAHALAVPAGYLLLRRLARPELALSAAMLWATSPFLVAHGRLLHLDALLADFVTLTVLATLVACNAARPRPWLLLAGVLCGLALLTKGPALILLPFLGLALFGLGGRQTVDGAGQVTEDDGRWTVPGAKQTEDGGQSTVPGGSAPAIGYRLSAIGYRLSAISYRLRWSVPRYLLLLAVAGLTILLLWPALWAAPGRAAASYVGEIVDNGGRPNGDGQFFLGSSAADPGPGFYPLATLFRLSPVELLGLGLALGFAVAALRRRPALAVEATTLLALAAFALWWLAVMSAGPKKFDRYILPLWPAMLTLSAYGLVEGAAWLGKKLHWASVVRRRSSVVALLLLQAAVLAWYHPYALSYYSPLLGGGPAAQRSFLIGWGEGMDQAGAWLRARPDIQEGQILSALAPTLQPFVPVPVREVRALGSVPANYAVVYLESLQRGDAPELYARIRETLPLHTVRIHGIDYAQIFQLPKPFATPVNATFGAALRLRGYSAELAAGQLVVTPAWDVRAPLPPDLMLFVHLLDSTGLRVAGIDVRPGGASLPPTGQWQPGQQLAVPLPIDLPAELPAGVYTLTLGLYDPTSLVRLSLTAGPRADQASAGPDAALLGEIRLP